MVRQRSAKSLYGGSIPPQASKNKSSNLYIILLVYFYAQVAELVYALVLGTSGEILGGSSPLLGTKRKQALACFFMPRARPLHFLRERTRKS